MPVTVVIPFHNQVAWLNMCLRALSRSTIEKQVIVIDDASDDAERQVASAICSSYPDVELRNNEQHRGFGGACNTGATYASYELVVFLNTDCLVAPNTLAEMAQCASAANISIVSTLTNNAVETSFPIFTGLSYVDMADILSESATLTNHDRFVDCRTAEGHCMLIKKQEFLEMGGFSPKWGIGYGEETDLHFRTVTAGRRSVVCVSTYVYHQGSQTFRTTPEASALRERNRAQFLKKWGEQYRASAHLDRAGPIEAEKIIGATRGDLRKASYDVLFILPGISQGIGGIQTVLDIVNDLTLRGRRANVVLSLDSDLHDAEAMLTRPLLAAGGTIAKLAYASVVVSTHQSTIPLGEALAAGWSATHVNFVQGMETFFSHGLEAHDTVERLKTPKHFLINSSWTGRMIAPFVDGAARLHLVYPFIPSGIFIDRKRPRFFDVVVALRNAPDKGQYRLLDLLYRLTKKIDGLNIAVLAAPRFHEHLERTLGAYQVHSFPDGVKLRPSDWSMVELEGSNLFLLRAPVSRNVIASIFNHSKIFVDTSEHEGFGLMIAEAALCGTTPICLDSGGFTSDFRANAVVIQPGPDSQSEIVDAIVKQLLTPAQIPTLGFSFEEATEAVSSLVTSSLPQPPLRFGPPKIGLSPGERVAIAPGHTRARVKLARSAWRTLPSGVRWQILRLSKIFTRLSEDD